MKRTALVPAVLAAALGVPGPGAADDLTRDLAILRVKPATVLILTQVGGQARTRCGPARRPCRSWCCGGWGRRGRCAPAWSSAPLRRASMPC